MRSRRAPEHPPRELTCTYARIPVPLRRTVALLESLERGGSAGEDSFLGALECFSVHLVEVL